MPAQHQKATSTPKVCITNVDALYYPHNLVLNRRYSYRTLRPDKENFSAQAGSICDNTPCVCTCQMPIQQHVLDKFVDSNFTSLLSSSNEDFMAGEIIPEDEIFPMCALTPQSGFVLTDKKDLNSRPKKKKVSLCGRKMVELPECKADYWLVPVHNIEPELRSSFYRAVKSLISVEQSLPTERCIINVCTNSTKNVGQVIYTPQSGFVSRSRTSSIDATDFHFLDLVVALSRNKLYYLAARINAVIFGRLGLSDVVRVHQGVTPLLLFTNEITFSECEQFSQLANQIATQISEDECEHEYLAPLEYQSENLSFDLCSLPHHASRMGHVRRNCLTSFPTFLDDETSLDSLQYSDSDSDDETSQVSTFSEHHDELGFLLPQSGEDPEMLFGTENKVNMKEGPQPVIKQENVLSPEDERIMEEIPNMDILYVKGKAVVVKNDKYLKRRNYLFANSNLKYLVKNMGLDFAINSFDDELHSMMNIYMCPNEKMHTVFHHYTGLPCIPPKCLTSSDRVYTSADCPPKRGYNMFGL